MTPQLSWTLDFVFAASLVILATALLLHVRRVSRALSSLKLEEAKRRISDLEKQAEKTEQTLSVIEKEGAQAKIKAQILENELKEVKETSTRYLGIFKTVLYGFDYIVQGCKNALEIEAPPMHPQEKQITSDEKDAPPKSESG